MTALTIDSLLLFAKYLREDDAELDCICEPDSRRFENHFLLRAEAQQTFH